MNKIDDNKFADKEINTSKNNNIKFNRIYKIINIIFILLAIYALFYPVFSSILTNIFPEMVTCPHKYVTGEDCPLCGGTRYFSNILQGNLKTTDLYSPFFIMFICVIIEIISRIYLLLQSDKITKKIYRLDICWHLLIAFSYISYLIIYFI